MLHSYPDLLRLPLDRHTVQQNDVSIVRIQSVCLIFNPIFFLSSMNTAITGEDIEGSLRLGTGGHDYSFSIISFHLLLIDLYIIISQQKSTYSLRNHPVSMT